MRLLLAEYFRRIGFQVEERESGSAALEATIGGRFDCFIFDVSMPGMSGIELLKRVREIDPRVQVVLATGTPDDGDARVALELGAFRYLVKPVEPGFLRLVLEQASRARD